MKLSKVDKVSLAFAVVYGTFAFFIFHSVFLAFVWAGAAAAIYSVLVGAEHKRRLDRQAKRDQCFKELNQSVEQHQKELANNPQLREEVEAEQRLRDNTLMDGLEDE